MVKKKKPNYVKQDLEKDIFQKLHDIRRKVSRRFERINKNDLERVLDFLDEIEEILE